VGSPFKANFFFSLGNRVLGQKQFPEPQRLSGAGLLSPEKPEGPTLDQDGFEDYRRIHGESCRV